jgi:hypothetical protein
MRKPAAEQEKPAEKARITPHVTQFLAQPLDRGSNAPKESEDPVILGLSLPGDWV